jgi:hypothetical protein
MSHKASHKVDGPTMLPPSQKEMSVYDSKSVQSIYISHLRHTSFLFLLQPLFCRLYLILVLNY